MNYSDNLKSLGPNFVNDRSSQGQEDDLKINDLRKDCIAALDSVESDITGLIVGAVPFISAEITGTGAGQSIPHTLGSTPSKVLIIPTSFSGSYTVVEGAHTSTDVILTATSGAKFKVVAWA